MSKKALWAVGGVAALGAVWLVGRPKAKAKPRPIIELSTLVIYPTQVKPGESVVINVLATNVGDVDVSPESPVLVKLRVNGNMVDSQEVALPAGGSTNLTFSVTADDPGTYSVDVDGLKGAFEVVEIPQENEVPLPSELWFRITWISKPFKVAYIWYEVFITNKTSVTQTYDGRSLTGGETKMLVSWVQGSDEEPMPVYVNGDQVFPSYRPKPWYVVTSDKMFDYWTKRLIDVITIINVSDETHTFTLRLPQDEFTMALSPGQKFEVPLRVAGSVYIDGEQVWP